MTRTGYVEGKCSRCGKIHRRKYPADLAVCDCYKYCPLCGKEMTAYTPDLQPRTYRLKTPEIKHETVTPPDWTMETVYVCNNHTPPHYSKVKPVEVTLS